MPDLPPPEGRPPKPWYQLEGWQVAALLGVVGVVALVAFNVFSSNGDGGPSQTPSQAFCSDLSDGTTADQLGIDADDAFGYMSISCPDELERHRAYFDNWGINIDA